jgi:DNA-binding NarL/FixJ family response regulator
VKVLIVDDSIVVRDRIAGMLSSISGVEVVGTAANSIDAIYLVNKLKPDAVTLDIRIPGESGIEVLKKIKKNQSSIIVMMLTNYPQEQYKTKCYKLGGDYFFSKSDEFEKVEEVVSKLARRIQFN